MTAGVALPADPQGSERRRFWIGPMLVVAITAGLPARAAPPPTALEAAASLLAGSAVRSGTEKDGIYRFEPSLDDMLALANDPAVSNALRDLAKRGTAIKIESELSQPDKCLFEVRTTMDAKGIFASTYTVRVDLMNSKAAVVRKRADGTPEGILLGEANLTCHRFSVTTMDGLSNPGVPKCNNVSSTVPIDGSRWMATAHEMSANYCPLGKIE